MTVKKLDEPKNRSGPVDYMNPPLSQQVRDLLARAGLSQREGAHELGVPERKMRYWCSGAEDPPRMAILALERLVEMRRTIQE